MIKQRKGTHGSQIVKIKENNKMSRGGPGQRQTLGIKSFLVFYFFLASDF